MTPSAQVRPRFRYWMLDPSVDHDMVASDIRAAGAIGAGGVELVAFYNYGFAAPPGADWLRFGYGTPEYLKMFRTALTAHQESNLVMDFAMGPNQGQGVPASIDDPGLQWDLAPSPLPLVQTFAVAPIPTDGVYQGSIPGWGTGELVSLVAAVVTSKQNSSRSLPGAFMLNNASWSTWTVEDGSLVDLTSNATAELGSIAFALSPLTDPSHSWQLFAFYQYQTHFQNLAYQSGSNHGVWTNGSYAVDHFSHQGAQTITRFWDEHILVDGIEELLKDVGNYGWEDSVELTSNMTWSPGFPKKFKESFGYDLKKYLPIVMFDNNNLGLQPTAPGSIQCILDTADGGEGVRNDFRQIIGEGYQDYLRALSNWTNTRLNLKFSAQPGYNMPLDMLSSIPFVDVPECESLGFTTVDAVRQFSGPAQMAGKRIISSEMGAKFFKAYSYTLPELVASFNKAVAGGVNQVVLHGQSYSGNYYATTWPGYAAFGYAVSDLFSPKQPAWDHGFSEVLDYMARTQFVLQRGISRVDIAILHKESATNYSLPPVYTSDDLHREGWTYNYVNWDNLRLPNARILDGTLAPDGPAYKALVILKTQSITVAVVELLESYAISGLPVVLVGGLPGQFSQGIPVSPSTFSEALGRLVRSVNVHQVSFGGVAQKLHELGLRPRAKVLASGTWYNAWVEDTAEGRDSLFVFNDSPTSSGTINIAGGKIPYRLDPWTGQRTPLLDFVVNHNGTITIQQTLAAQEAVILEFSGTTDYRSYPPFTTLPPPIVGYEDVGSDRVILHAIKDSFDSIVRFGVNGIVRIATRSVPSPFLLSNWTLEVEHWEAPDDIWNASIIAEKSNTTHHLTELVSWLDHETLCNASGIGYYTTSFEIPRADGSSGELGFYLLFSDVLHAVQVFINGHKIPPINSLSARQDISSIWDRIENGGDVKLLDRFIAAGVTDAPRTDNGLVGSVHVIPFRRHELEM
ncbi:hypothetical protein CSIM01_06239 [Colletotrichum simmondsii]|uniref:Secreted protein n=1 Tax=Colletotrichum simmondsii TaxID=703756 RepID=A0A135S0R8_9PEZI|nr:hypothetical protein CSIM01_06239 [Colletotrichum simmondsii]